jgi:hypothetical protein
MCSEFTAQLKVDQTLNRIWRFYLRCFCSNVHEVMDMGIGGFMRKGETCWLLWRLVPVTETKSEEELPSLETNISVAFVPSGNMERFMEGGLEAVFFLAT